MIGLSQAQQRYLSWPLGADPLAVNTSKDELLQRIKTRFEKSKDLVVRACLEVVQQ